MRGMVPIFPADSDGPEPVRAMCALCRGLREVQEPCRGVRGGEDRGHESKILGGDLDADLVGIEEPADAGEALVELGRGEWPGGSRGHGGLRFSSPLSGLLASRADRSGGG
jgi:hypothetical protein